MSSIENDDIGFINVLRDATEDMDGRSNSEKKRMQQKSPMHKIEQQQIGMQINRDCCTQSIYINR